MNVGKSATSVCRWVNRLLFGLCAVVSAHADSTFVTGGNIDAIWSPSGSPYVVQGNLTVQAADSLTIEQGVKVYFAGPFSLSVFGYLGVNGSEGDSIRFTTDTLANPSKWRGLSLTNANDSSFIRYAIFEHAYAPGPLGPDSLGGAIYVGGGTSVRIEHSSFFRNRSELAGGGVYVTSSTLWMDSCRFERNLSRAEGAGLFLNNSIGSTVSNTKFFRNSSTSGSGGGMYVRGTTPYLTRCAFDSNSARVNGGGIMFKNSFATMDSSTLYGNHGRGHGGGIACENSSPNIFDCVISANYTTDFDGGGLYNWESSPHVLRCQVLNNRSADDGGGIHSYREPSDGLFEQCEVRGNTAIGEGGGLWVTLEGSPTFVDCVIRDNEAGLYGGGVYLRNDAKPTFVNCDFDSNMSLGNGGGLSIRQSQPQLIECRIRGNTADAEGGGVHLWEAADAVFDDCLIEDNQSDLNGGGVSVNQSTLHATNCAILRNQTAALGGGLTTQNAAKLTLRHCTIGGNQNGGIRLESSVADIENTIIGASTGANVYLSSASSSRIAYSLLDGSLQFAGGDPSQGPSLLGVLTATNGNGDSCDTFFNLFAPAGFTDAANGEFTLDAGSMAIGSGNWNTVDSDLTGNTRPLPALTLPDMGAYEHSLGTPPAGLFGSLSGVLGPDTFKVVADIVVDSTNSLTLPAGTTLIFCGPSGLRVSGELQAEGVATDSVWFVTDTVTNPGRWRGITFGGNSGSSVLDFVSVSDSRALTTTRTQGGAVRLSGVSPAFTHCTMNRHSALQGGVVYLDGASPHFTECVFSNGSADSGGVICARSGSAPVFDQCLITGGQAAAGGGYLAQGASGQLLNCRFENNTSVSTGGAVLLDAAAATVWNCLFLNNSSTTGGAIWLGSTSANVKFNTLAGNTAVDGAGIYMRFGSSQIKNNIIAHNNGDGIYFFVAPSSVIRNNCVANNDSAAFAFFGNSPSQGPVGLGSPDSLNWNGDPCDRYYNIQLDPQWVSGSGHDYYLSHVATGEPDDSPCINAAESSAVAPVGTTRTDFVADGGIADQGYHGPQLAGPPVAIDDLVIRASADSVRLHWSYDGAGLFTVKTDSLISGSFSTIVAVTADTFVVLPLTPPLHPTRSYFHVIVEP